MGSHKTVTQTGRNIGRTKWRLNVNTVIAIILYAWIVTCIDLFDNIKSMCYTVALKVWMHDYVNCMSFKCFITCMV